MAVHDMLMAAAGGTAGAVNYVDDVFSTYLYTGNGSTQTITNGIDLATKGGMVWIKSRSNIQDNCISDSALGIGSGGYYSRLITNSTAAANTGITGGPSAFNSNGWSGGGGTSQWNSSGATYASWTFAKQAKFFDVVTYTGTGSNRTIAHNLGSVPGCIIVKCTSLAGEDWRIYHTSLGATKALRFTTDAAVTNSTYWNNTNPTSTVFTVGTNSSVNQSGATYVAYLFAHNAGGFGTAGTDNVISCGSYTTSGSGTATVNLGYEPQWLLVKSASSSGDDWKIIDNMRGFIATGSSTILMPNSTSSESTTPITVTSTGFNDNGAVVANGTVIYIAIRRPMKPPTTGTEVFASTLWTGPSSNTNIDMGSQTNGFGTGSLSILKQRNGTQTNGWFDTLRGSTQFLWSSGTNAESTDPGGISVVDNKLRLNSSSYFGAGGDGAGVNYVAHHFKRAPGFFDEVCYTGDGTIGQKAIAHNLGVVPELIITKPRNGGGYWYGTAAGLTNPNNYYIALNSNAAEGNYGGPFINQRTSTSFSVNTIINGNTDTYVAYLFATVAGVSKVGSYTGNGSSQTINCGFSGGARFVMIKRTDSTNHWYVWDSSRGIVSGNDPYSTYNTAFAEQTAYDSIDPDSSGFIVNSDGTGNNTSGATYIYLAIA